MSPPPGSWPGDTHRTAGNPNAARASRAAWQQVLAILDDLNHPDADQLHAELAAITTGSHTTKTLNKPAGSDRKATPQISHSTS